MRRARCWCGVRVMATLERRLLCRCCTRSTIAARAPPLAPERRAPHVFWTLPHGAPAFLVFCAMLQQTRLSPRRDAEAPGSSRGGPTHSQTVRSEGDLRVIVRHAGARLANAKATLRRREAALEQAELDRDVRFSKDTMMKEARKAAEGLNFGNIGELRALKFAPPPIAQLVMRCVATLIVGNDFGDFEAYEATELAISARCAQPAPSSARARQQAASERLASSKSPRASSPRPLSARGEGPLLSARSERPASARGDRPPSARGERTPMSARGDAPLSARASAEQQQLLLQDQQQENERADPPPAQAAEAMTTTNARMPLSARQTAGSPRPRHEAEEQRTPRQPGSARNLSEAADKSARSASPRGPASREVDIAVTKRGELLSWDATLKMFGRTDFKWRLMNLSGRALLDNKDIVDAVHNCLDLSTLTPGRKLSILPGRAHAGDQLDEVRARRELTSCLYQAHAEAGVNMNPLRFEEARYVNEVTGAMLIWMHRIFSQHNILLRIWDRLTGAVRAAEAQVFLAKKAVSERETALEDLEHERVQLRERRKEKEEMPRPTEFTTPDQIVLERPSPNVFFQNGRVAGRSTAVGPAVPWDLPSRFQLPSRIHFYVRLKHVQVPFPLPARYPASQYLLEARVVDGQEAFGPVAHVPFDPAHVIGLGDQELLSFTQLVIEVPSTPKVNAEIYATRLSFHPRHATQLHGQSKRTRRIIVPVFAIGGRASDWPRPSSAPHVRRRSPERHEVALDAASERREIVERMKAMHIGPAGHAHTHMAPVGVPQLAIPRSPSPTIGSPFNADVLLNTRHGSPKRRVAVASIAATPQAASIESLISPLVEKVEAGYVLLAEELAELKRLAALAASCTYERCPASALNGRSCTVVG